MEFNQQQYNHTPSPSSSIYTYFSDQAAKEGLWNGTTSMRRSPREEIQIELEKERIREQIIAKEIARLNREMAAGFPSNNRLQPEYVPFHRQNNVNYMGNGSSELNHRSSEFWNQNGSRVYGESQSWGFREGPWG
ncbi:hypothetical protein OSB04_012442 [Centaurea solstitialis]|uniref:Uncharacterized protein n=1 Tax=Centaurea solstitialis TaxID=347529 RepID=A0AA38TW44_9ASTR|nr:hypothetical protein OSB04_012442 [Centaurea solstitialis]